MKLTITIILNLCTVALGFSQNILSRKPYLQKMGADQVTIHWRTLDAGTASVKYGTDANNLNLESINESPSTLEHVVQLSDLNANTTYYYQILINGNELGDVSEQFFATAPKHGSKDELHFWVIGDAGTGNQTQIDVLNAYLNYSDKKDPDLTLMLGDNAYFTGLDLEYQTNLFDIYSSFYTHVPFFTAFGNHDSYSTNPLTETGAYFSNFDLPSNGELGGEPSNTKAFYSFDYGNVHIISLDANMLQNLLKPGIMIDWLRKDLEQNKQDWTIAIWHHPPYTKGSHDSDTEDELIHMREVINPILEEYGVDLGLGGHSHNYERSYLINGHYGMSETFNPEEHIVRNGTNSDNHFLKLNKKGTMYIVNGNSGGQVSSGNMDHPSTAFSSGLPGSMLLDIVGDEMRGRYLDSDGNLIDEFTLRKPAVTSVQEIESKAYQLSVISSPTDNELNLKYYLPKQTKANLILRDLTGKEIHRTNLNQSSGFHYETINSSNLQSGIYILSLTNDFETLETIKIQLLR